MKPLNNGYVLLDKEDVQKIIARFFNIDAKAVNVVAGCVIQWNYLDLEEIMTRKG